MINWSVESEDALMTTYVRRYSVLDRTIEARVVYDKAINKYKLRFISIKPINEIEVSLLTILTPHFRFTIDYVQDSKVAMIYPGPGAGLYDDLQSVDAYVDSLITLVVELLSYSSNPLLRTEINYELVSRNWVLDLSDTTTSMFKVYDTRVGVIRVSVELEHRQLELGKVRVDVLVRAITSLKCVVDALISKGFSAQIIYEDIGIANLTAEFPSLGILTLIASKLDDIINEVEASCS